jgi:hypothetical protein
MLMMVEVRPWTPARATERIRALANDDAFDIHLTSHAKAQMLSRGLILGDVLHVLRHGFVYAEGQPSTRPGFFKYAMECRTPNSGNRTVRVIVIPAPQGCSAKLVTVMWTDEPMLSH